VTVVLTGACTKQHRPSPTPEPNDIGWMTLCRQRPQIDLGAVAAEARQDVAHTAFGPPKGLGAVPTNQWWSSLLSPHAEALWAQPLVVSWTPEGVALAVQKPHGTANTIFGGQASPLVIFMPGVVPHVESYGDFHVQVALEAERAKTAGLTVAQGSPATWFKVGSGGLILDAPDRSTFRSSADKPLDAVSTWSADEVRVTAPDGSGWTVVLPSKASWRHIGRRLQADVAPGVVVGLVARPEATTAKWNAIARNVGRHPVTGTQAAWKRQPGSVTQRLTWVGAPGAVALLPHQVAGQVNKLGVFRSSRGDMPVIAASTISWDAPLPGVLLGVPTLSPEALSAVKGHLANDAQPPIPAGAYFGPKALGRAATQTDLAMQADPVRAKALAEKLSKDLENTLIHEGGGDDRWVGYDQQWGGLQSMPPQFGSETYNDHNFQNGYLLQAAATLAELGDARQSRIRPFLDLIVADIGTMDCHAGFPPFRVMNAYEGHSNASGFAPFIDGNNAESSSEAVHAWWSMARWAAATGQTSLLEQALALYATEAAVARWYWLGEQGTRAEGYTHRVAGIVWGGKVDFATWFDPRPASIVGIQLLPFTFGSLYRNDPAAAAKRFDEGSANSGDRWSDLLALDLAISDPAKAASVVAKAPSIEEGNSRAFSAAWTGFLSAVGGPDPTVIADPPLGMGFRRGTGPMMLVAVNPSEVAATVTFRKGGRVIGTITVNPRSASSQSG
jgi:endo-1,3(4)-beta-glucanase